MDAPSLPHDPAELAELRAAVTALFIRLPQRRPRIGGRALRPRS